MVLFKDFYRAYSDSDCDFTVSELFTKLRYWFRNVPVEFCGLSCVDVGASRYPVLIFRDGRHLLTFTFESVCNTDFISVLPKRAFEVEFNDILLPW